MSKPLDGKCPSAMSSVATAMPTEATKEPQVEFLSEEQKRYVQLANLKAPQISEAQAGELWHIVRGIAVLDWALMQMDPPPNAEERWRTLCRKAHQIAMQLLEESHVNHSIQ